MNSIGVGFFILISDLSGGRITVQAIEGITLRGRRRH
jgi:hypothetical protein